METTLLTKENAHRVTMVRRVDAPCSSYNLTSFSPDERGESDFASH